MTTRQELLQALAEMGERRPRMSFADLFYDAATHGCKRWLWDVTDEQLLEGLRKLME